MIGAVAELVAEHDELEVLGSAGADGEVGQAGDEAVENARHSRSASALFSLISGHGRMLTPTGSSCAGAAGSLVVGDITWLWVAGCVWLLRSC